MKTPNFRKQAEKWYYSPADSDDVDSVERLLRRRHNQTLKLVARYFEEKRTPGAVFHLMVPESPKPMGEK